MAKKGDKITKPPIGSVEDPNSLYHFMLRYLEAQRVLNRSAASLQTLEYNLRGFIRWCEDRGLQRPNEISKPVLDRYQKHVFYYRKPNGAPLSISAQCNYLSAVKAYFKWLARQNYIMYNPASEIDLPKSGHTLPTQVLSLER